MFTYVFNIPQNQTTTRSNELHNIACLRYSAKHISCIIAATTFCIDYDYKISHKHIQPKHLQNRILTLIHFKKK